jgi:hypothetical protein
MSATSTAGRDNGRVLGGWLHLVKQQVEWAGHLADRLDSNACVERRRIELLMSERTRAIMRTFYVTETQSSVGQDPMFASAARASVCDTQLRPLP